MVRKTFKTEAYIELLTAMAKSLVISDFSLVVFMIALSRFVAKYGLIIPFQTVNPFLFQQVREPRQREARAGNVLWSFDRIGKVQ